MACDKCKKWGVTNGNMGVRLTLGTMSWSTYSRTSHALPHAVSGRRSSCVAGGETNGSEDDMGIGGKGDTGGFDAAAAIAGAAI